MVTHDREQTQEGRRGNVALHDKVISVTGLGSRDGCDAGSSPTYVHAVLPNGGELILCRHHARVHAWASERGGAERAVRSSMTPPSGSWALSEAAARSLSTTFQPSGRASAGGTRALDASRGRSSSDTTGVGRPLSA